MWFKPNTSSVELIQVKDWVQTIAGTTRRVLGQAIFWYSLCRSTSELILHILFFVSCYADVPFFSPYICDTVLDGFTICHASVFHAYTVLQGQVLRGLFLGVVFAMLVVIPFFEREHGRTYAQRMGGCWADENTNNVYPTIKDVIKAGFTGDERYEMESPIPAPQRWRIGEAERTQRGR